MRALSWMWTGETDTKHAPTPHESEVSGGEADTKPHSTKPLQITNVRAKVSAAAAARLPAIPFGFLCSVMLKL